MVTFLIDSKDDTQAVYKYYPENNTDKTCGIIRVNLSSKEITIDTVAEEDFVCRASADELNEMRNSINQMRLERGEPPLTEEELPTAVKDSEWYFYADHVIRRVIEELEKGAVPEKGTVAWY